MSMIGSFRRARDARIEALLQHPDEIVDYLGADADDEAGEDDAYADLDVDKVWHGM
jgi:hypothetical protein